MFISGVCCLIASMPTERARQTRRRHSTFTSNKYQIHLANNLCRFFYLAAPLSVFYSNAAVIAAARVHGRYSFCIHCFDLAYQSLCISSISPIGLHPQHSGIYTHDSSHTSVYSPLAKAPTHLTSEIGGRYRIVRTPSRMLLSSSRSLGFPSPLLTPLPRPLSLSRNIRSMAELAPETDRQVTENCSRISPLISSRSLQFRLTLWRRYALCVHFQEPVQYTRKQSPYFIYEVRIYPKICSCNSRNRAMTLKTKSISHSLEY